MRHFSPWHLPLALAGATLLASAACSTPRPRLTHEQLARRVSDAWTSHDVGIVDEVFAEDGVYEDITAGTKREGREDIKAGFNVNHAAVPDFKVELTEVFSTGSMVACEWVMSGTQTGDYPGIPATGKPFSVRGASIVQVRDGKIIHWTDYYDGFSFLRQLGVVSFPPSPQHQ